MLAIPPVSPTADKWSSVIEP